MYSTEGERSVEKLSSQGERSVEKLSSQDKTEVQRWQEKKSGRRT